MKTLDIVEQGFAQEQEKLNKRRNAWRAFKRTQHALPALMADIQKLEPTLDLTFSDYEWISVYISGDKHKLAAAVRALRVRGYSTSEAPPAKGQSQWNPLFTKEGAPSVYLVFTSTVCRRVEVGKKTIEVPVYDTVCEEITLDRSAEEGAESAPEPEEIADAIPF